MVNADPAARQDRRRRRRLSRRRRQHADPQGHQGSRAAACRYAGDQGLSRKRGRQALRRAAAADPAWRACRTTSGSPGSRRRAAAARCGSASSCSRRPIPNARVFVGAPTWPNHPPIIRAVGLEAVEYPYYERGQGDHPLRGHDRRAAKRRSRATSPCSTAAATIRPAPTSTKTSGARSSESSSSAG